VENVSIYNQHSQQMLQQMKWWFMSRGSDAYTAGRQALGAMYGLVQRQAAMMSFVEAFWIMAVIFWAVVPMVMLLNNPRHHFDKPTVATAPKEKLVGEYAEEAELVEA